MVQSETNTLQIPSIPPVELLGKYPSANEETLTPPDAG